MASLQINNSTIQSIAERIVQARRLYGADSSYVIGLFQGLDLLLAGSDADSVRQQLQEQVVKLEGSTPRPSSATGGGQQRPDSRRATATAETAPSSTAADDALAENTWIRGAVKWFNNDKGYGFISTAADADVFVHWRDISSWDRSLTQGDEVEFMVTKTAKGFQAINVMKPGSGDGTSEAAPAADDDAAAAQASAQSAAEEPDSGQAETAASPTDEQPAADPEAAQQNTPVAAAPDATSGAQAGPSPEGTSA